MVNVKNGASDLYKHLGNLGIIGHSEGGGPGAGGGLWGAAAGGQLDIARIATVFLRFVLF